MTGRNDLAHINPWTRKTIINAARIANTISEPMNRNHGAQLGATRVSIQTRTSWFRSSFGN